MYSDRSHKTSRDTATSLLAESADGGVNSEPPPPPYDELVVDEAVAKITISADSKDLAVEDELKARENQVVSLFLG